MYPRCYCTSTRPLTCGFTGKAFAAEVHFVHQAADGALLVQAAPPEPHPTPPSEHTTIQVFGVLIEVVSASSEEYLQSPMFPVFSSFFSISGQDKV